MNVSEFSSRQLLIMNVEEYLQRISYTGSREPNLKNLGAISLAHKIAVPYTSLDIFGGERIVLDLETMYKKVVVNKGGGLCYELNWLFKWLLEQLGYKVHCGQGAFYRPELGEFTVPFYHMLPFITIDKQYYLCDPGWVTVGPMKIQHMHFHVETHAVYRSRNVPSMGNSWFFVERHKKTVLDSKGNILKQGPAQPGVPTGYCNEECSKEESSHWSMLFRVCAEPQSLDDFKECNEMHQDKEDGLFRTSMLIHRFEANCFVMTFGEGYTVKEIIDPNTDKILAEKSLENDEEVVKVCREFYKYEVKHKVNFFSRKKLKKQLIAN